MTSNRMLLAACASLLGAGCAQTGIVSAPGCETYVVEMGTCEGNGNSPIVTLNLDDMTVDKPYICANRSTVIMFKLEPVPAENDTVAVVPKKGTDTWLVGSNSTSKQMIKVKVPPWEVSETDHEYAFVTRDGRCLDPRVRVR